MSRRPNRLSASDEHKLSGSLIDRGKPLRFRLNGREVSGFEGDTVLSALLAAGIDTAGEIGDSPLALSDRFAPPVLLASKADAPQNMLPMQRMPAVNGLDLVTVGGPDEFGKKLLGRLFRSRSLDQNYDQSVPLPGFWIDAAPAEEFETDLLVIGGGIAGLSAAARAIRDGKSVMLVERDTELGGIAEYYGGSEGLDAPESVMTKLSGLLARRNKATVLTRAEVIALGEGTARIHQIVAGANGPEGRVVSIRAPHCVLATGAPGRMPVFSGNRLPGVWNAETAFQMSRRYGIWPGRQSVFSVSVSPAYRAVMLASEAGIEVKRLTDTRIEHQSAHLGYAAAAAIPLAPGLIPVEVEQIGRSGDLDIRFAAILDEKLDALDPIQAQSLVVAGNPRPELGLWRQAGGQMQWDAQSGAYLATGHLPGVVLVGSAAGYKSFAACLQSGEQAIDILAGERKTPIEDIYEDGADGDNSFGRVNAPYRSGPAFLDIGPSLVRRQGPDADESSSRADLRASEDLRALSIDDVEARILLGELDAERAKFLLQERCIVPQRIVPTAHQSSATRDVEGRFEMPPYLAMRFGSKPARLTITANDGRRLPIGGLIYSRSGTATPEDAIGAILGEVPADPAQAIALVDAEQAPQGGAVIIRDVSGETAATLGAPYRAAKSSAG